MAAEYVLLGGPDDGHVFMLPADPIRFVASYLRRPLIAGAEPVTPEVDELVFRPTGTTDRNGRRILALEGLIHGNHRV